MAVAGQSAGDRRGVVERILASRSFEKSARMRSFLAYVCTRAIDEPGVDIHEQEIGCAVFGRKPDYDTGDDNIVRVNASQVRKKLEAYFAGEGAGESLVFDLPKGRYVPVFRPRAEAPVEFPPEPVVQPSRSPIPMWLGALIAVLAMTCMGLAVALWNARATPKTLLDASPMLNSLWPQLIRREQQTDLVVTDSSLGLMQDLLGRPVALAEYLKPEFWRVDSLASQPAVQDAARLAGRRHYTSLANLNIGRRVLLLAGPNERRVVLVSAREFNIRQLKSDNVILLGSKRANPWVELMEPQLNFRFGYDTESHQSYFQNQRPRAGEEAVYRNNPVLSYCQIAYLPNLEHSGNVLLISGTEMEGTELGGEFLTNERWISSLQRFVQPLKSGRLPYFELLLRSNKIGGASPGFEVVAFRLLNQ